MLTRLIVAAYGWLIEAGLWVAVAVAAVVGYRHTLPVMLALGAVPTPAIAWQITGAVVLPIVTLLVLALLTGPILILVDIRRSIRSLEARMDREVEARRSAPVERKEPTL